MQEQVKQQHIPVKVYRGVLMVALPISDQTSPARLTLERVTPTHGEHKGNAGHLATCVQI